MAIKINGTANELIFYAGSANATSLAGAAGSVAWTMTLPVGPGTAGQVLATDGAGNLSWVTGGGGTPGGPANSVQFNNGGVLGGAAGLTFNGTNTLSLGASSGGGNLQLFNAAGTFSTTLRTGATANWTLTLPVTAGAAGEVLTTDGAGNLSWVATSGTTIPITNDTTTAANQFPLFSSVSTGTLSAVSTASPDYTYNPASERLTAPYVAASSAIFLNANALTANFTIPAGMNGLSAGPIATGAFTVNVPPGSAWKVV